MAATLLEGAPIAEKIKEAVSKDLAALKAEGVGIDAARFRNNDAIGIAIGNFANEMTALYVSQGQEMQFTDEAITTGLFLFGASSIGLYAFLQHLIPAAAIRSRPSRRSSGGPGHSPSRRSTRT